MKLLLAAFSALLSGAMGALVCARSPRLCSALGMIGVLAGCALGGWASIVTLTTGKTDALAVAWSIPNGALSLGIDPLSAFFLAPLFALGAITAVYGRAYLLHFAANHSLAVPWAAFNVLVLSMAVLLVSRHAVLFLVAWETMSISAYLLVTFEHEQAQARRAGWIYLIATHVGVVFLIELFLLLGRHAGSFEFDAMVAASAPTVGLSGVLFLLALVGFGVKVGLWPLHVWLPEAHAAAPSHVSALMSGVLIKMGIYGILRIVVLMGGLQPWWGPLLMCLGIGSAVLGIALALYQRDLKRVLAYSSIENVGLITLGLGIGFWGATSGRPVIATLGLVGGLLHVWNHALMKGLLFLSAGSILHGCHSKDLEQLGGLSRRMPLTAATLTIGATAIAGLPPLNGFVSEWPLYLGLLHGALDVRGAGGVAALVAIAALSLVGAMAALCFVRIICVALLGEARGRNAEQAHESSLSMTAPMALLALAATVLALVPGVVVGPLDRVVAQLLGPHGAHVPAPQIGLARLGSLNAALVAALAFGAFAALVLQRRTKVIPAQTWGCGYAAPSARMQYTASAVAELFTATLLPRALSPRLSLRPPQGLFPAPGRLESDLDDPLTRAVYEPFFARWAMRFARLRWMQQGQLHVYIVYIVVTLLAALTWSAAQLSWASQ